MAQGVIQTFLVKIIKSSGSKIYKICKHIHTKNILSHQRGVSKHNKKFRKKNMLLNISPKNVKTEVTYLKRRKQLILPGEWFIVFLGREGNLCQSHVTEGTSAAV